MTDVESRKQKWPKTTIVNNEGQKGDIKNRMCKIHCHTTWYNQGVHNNNMQLNQLRQAQKSASYEYVVN